MKTSEQINELAAALSKAQGEMENAQKNKENPHFRSKYADLGGIWDAIRAPLAKHGLSVVQLPTTNTAGGVNVCTLIMHSSGQWIEAEYALPPTKMDAQGYGSAVTYMKRYALSGLGVAPEDDDGNGAARGKPIDVPAGPISADQMTAIHDMIDRTGTDIEKFCTYMKVKSIAEIPANQYDRAIAALKSKRKP